MPSIKVAKAFKLMQALQMLPLRKWCFKAFQWMSFWKTGRRHTATLALRRGPEYSPIHIYWVAEAMGGSIVGHFWCMFDIPSLSTGKQVAAGMVGSWAKGRKTKEEKIWIKLGWETWKLIKMLWFNRCVAVYSLTYLKTPAWKAFPEARCDDDHAVMDLTWKRRAVWAACRTM